MIALLTGRVVETGESSCVLDVQGVGYLLSCSRRTLDALTRAEGVQRVLVDTHLRQDALTLYGFHDAPEREAFRALIEVKTVGPQKALLVLSGLGPDALAAAIAAKDRKRLAEVKGLGAATANRIIDEPAMQKWAVGRATPEADGAGVAAPLPDEAVSALVNLGWKRPEAVSAIAGVRRRMGDDLPLGTLIREGLKALAPP